MRRRLSLCALTLFAAVWAQEAFAVVYVPGRYENGIYSRPHFRHDGGAAKSGLWLKRLVGSEAVVEGGEPAQEQEPKVSPPKDRLIEAR